MDKKSLRKITVGGPSAAVISTASILPLDAKKYECTKEYNIISAKVVDDILVLSAYTHSAHNKVNKDSLPVFVTYCSLKDNSYVSRNPSAEKDGKIKWYSSSIERKLEGYYYNSQTREWLTPSALFASSEDQKIVCDYLGFEDTENALCRIFEWQQGILDQKRAIQHKKIINDLHERMGHVPKEPDGLEDWFFTYVLRNYLIIDSEGCSLKQVHVTCTGCKKDAIVAKAPQFKHRTYTTCPICGRPVKSVSRGIYKRSGWMWESEKLTLIQKIDENTFLFRYYEGHTKLIFKLNFRETDNRFHEVARDFVTVNKNKVSYKRYEMQKKHGKYDFWDSPDNGLRVRTGYYPIGATGLERYAYGSFLYTKNLDEVLSDDRWTHFPLKELAQHFLDNPNDMYPENHYEYALEAYLKAPAIEKLIKVGLYGLSLYLTSFIYDDSLFNYKDNSLLGFLKLRNKNELEHLKVCDNYSTLQYLQKLSALKIDLSDEDWELARGAFNDLYANSVNDYTMRELHKTCPDLIPRKFIKYLMKQTKMKKLGAVKDYRMHGYYQSFIREYIDYRIDLKFVGIPVNRKNAYPEDLHEAHKLLRKQVEMKQRLIKLNQLKALNKKLDKAAKLFEKRLVESGLVSIEDKFFGFKDNTKYCLLLPHCKEDLSLEGAALDHCVGSSSYDEKIANRESVIMFLRKQDAKGKSYYTLEYDLKTKKFLQCRTIGDGSADHFGAESFESKRAIFNALKSPSGKLSVKTENDIKRLLEYSKLKKSDKAIADLIVKDAAALIKKAKYAYQSDEYNDLIKMHIGLDEYFAKGKNLTDTVIKNAFDALKNSTSGRSAVKDFRDKLEKVLAA